MADPAILSDDGVNAARARSKHHVDGARITVAVLDTGCRPGHKAFKSNGQSRILPGQNFAGGNVTETDDTSTSGHGTAIAGIIAGDDDAPVVIAPGAHIRPLRITSGNVANSFTAVSKALSWILANGGNQCASIICLAIGDEQNHPNVDVVLAGGDADKQTVIDQIRALRAQNIATVTPAGNRFLCHGENAGMAFPAIIPECFSVGAIFKDESVFDLTFDADCCHAHIDNSVRGEIAPFSQRLLRSVDGKHFTRCFAPGSPIRSLSNAGDDAISERRHGTSLAAPYLAGVIALLQQRHLEERGTLPSCNDLELWLRNGGDQVPDGPGTSYTCLNALGAMDAMMATIAPAAA